MMSSGNGEQRRDYFSRTECVTGLGSLLGLRARGLGMMQPRKKTSAN